MFRKTLQVLFKKKTIINLLIFGYSTSFLFVRFLVYLFDLTSKAEVFLKQLVCSFIYILFLLNFIMDKLIGLSRLFYVLPKAAD